MLSESERYYVLCIDALVKECFSKTNVSMCFGHGYSGHRVLSEHEVIMLCAYMLWLEVALGARTHLCFGHGWSGNHMLLEHEHHQAYTNVISHQAYALGS